MVVAITCDVENALTIFAGYAVKMEKTVDRIGVGRKILHLPLEAIHRSIREWEQRTVIFEPVCNY
jgi:hypothetical protein